MSGVRVMFYVGLFGIWLAGASMQKYIDRREYKYIAICMLEGVTGTFFVLQGA